MSGDLCKREKYNLTRLFSLNIIRNRIIDVVPQIVGNSLLRTRGTFNIEIAIFKLE